MAFRWEAGKVHVLGDLPGGRVHSYAHGLSADGQVIVGRSTAEEGGCAFVWDASHGMRRLDEVIQQYGADLDGWHLIEAKDVSADGRTIVGVGRNPRGSLEAFVATLPNEAY